MIHTIEFIRKTVELKLREAQYFSFCYADHTALAILYVKAKARITRP